MTIVSLAMTIACSKQRDPAPAASPVQRALAEGVDYLASFPADELRFDAAIGLHAIVRAAPSERARAAFEVALTVARRDDDSPLRRLFDPDARVSASSAAGWEAPDDPGARVPTNRVIGEAAHCADHGFRDQTLAYLRGPMRDDGGYQTTHAIWALHIANRRGCLPAATYDSVSRELAAELQAALERDPPPRTVAEADLHGERLLMLLLVDALPADAERQLDALLATQQPDGSFGAPDPGGRPYARYHATLVACWLLAEWQRGDG